ncbi:glycoside hydrolase family 2 TIM barrel-domain containing protein [Sinomicrobium soli]|uniref:glycoside hydrolase family 2 TIM barrel-domain containing protein n=1 Tax=Sinomicrobium sp. N-1-3-6 TaxID=2219864 RepID=UPI001F27F53F|nr:glycoside hydrolase family 2 TIM barrel-domain containing protein [Sinomicrobium sp. N-1-3-6]
MHKPKIERKQLFDAGWQFHLGDTARADTAGDWHEVDLPHDWSIASRPDSLNPSGGDGGYFANGTGWYKKVFEVPEHWEGKKVLIYFEGVYMNAEVFINGEKLGIQPYGYTSFDFDLTPYLKPGKQNVVAVRVDNSHQKNSRWYSGSGIYRHVWLKVTDPLHISHWGVAVTTPEIHKEQATVRVRTLVKNESTLAQDFVITSTVPLVSEKQTQVSIAPGREKEIVQELTVENPALWSPESPELYRLDVTLSRESDVVDEVTEFFGIRDIRFSAENGFELNGRKVILNGGNVHHDNGSLGAAAYDRAEVRKVALLKEAGFNAVRTAHNPPSEAFLYACDSLGLLVIDESFDGWRVKKTDHDYAGIFDEWWKHDAQSMVLRDRNHPSVILWSIGNEIIERKEPGAVETARKLSGAVKEIDATRPVTSAMTTWDAEWEIFDPLMAEHDVAGYNYQLHRAESDHERVPDRIILQTESYPKDAFYNWKMVQDHDYIIGDFVWTALDYLGESGIGRYFYPGEPEGEHWVGGLFPWHGAYCGDIDLTGWRKPVSHYRSMLYNGDEKLYMAVREPDPEDGKITLTSWAVWPAWESWTWPGQNGKTLTVDVYSRHPSVRLYLNDSLIGEKETTPDTQFRAVFEVPYHPGELKVAGMEDGREVETRNFLTAGEASKIMLSPDRSEIEANGQDLSFVVVEITDGEGILQPNADHKLQFALEGPGEIVAVDNADLKDTGSYVSGTRKAWHGRAMVVVKSTREKGDILLTVSSPGLPDATLTLHVKQ